MFDLSSLTHVYGSLYIGISATILLGGVVGFISASFGIGGGFVITPYFNAGLNLSATTAVATSMGQIPFMSLAGLVKYFKEKIINYRLAAWLLAGSLPASQVVAHYLGNIKDTSWGKIEVYGGMLLADMIIIVVFAVVIGVLGVYNLVRSYRGGKEKAMAKNKFTSNTQMNLITFCIGICFGFFSALLGIGGGFFFFSVFCLFLRFRTH